MAAHHVARRHWGRRVYCGRPERREVGMAGRSNVRAVVACSLFSADMFGSYGGGKSEMHMPAVEEGEDVAVHGVNMTQKMTEPPEMLSEVPLPLAHSLPSNH